MNSTQAIFAHCLGPAIRAADLGVWEWDLRTNAIWCSDRAKAIVGFAADEDVTLEKLKMIAHPDDRCRLQESLKHSLDPALRQRGAFEWRAIRPDGAVRWILAHGEAEFAEGGVEARPLRYVGAMQDVTEYKRAGLALRDSEARLRIALDAGRMAVWEYDIVHECLIGSPELNELLGFPRDYALSLKEVREGYPPGERERLRKARHEALERGDRFIEIEYPYRRRDGQVRWLLLRAEFILGADGGAQRMIGVLMDVTKRQAADETNAYLAAVASSSTDAIVTFNCTGDILTWNEAAERIFGYTKEEALGGARSILSPPNVKSSTATLVEKVWAGEVIQFEGERRRKDGGAFHAAITVAPVRAADGRVISVVATVRDATQRKNNERRQALLVRELHHRVRNTLATVQAIAGASARHAENLDEFRETFSQRIGSLAQAHALLTEDNWQSVNLRQLMLLELKPYAEVDRIALAGPPIVLDAQSAIPISMAVHELTTNAAKHGALSETGGRIEVTWVVSGAGKARELVLDWRETGGPQIEPPSHRGFGSLLLNTVLRMQLSAQVSSEYLPDGLHFQLTATMPEPAR